MLLAKRTKLQMEERRLQIEFVGGRGQRPVEPPRAPSCSISSKVMEKTAAAPWWNPKVPEIRNKWGIGTLCVPKVEA